jgi:leucyl aminopeptidase
VLVAVGVGDVASLTAATVRDAAAAFANAVPFDGHLATRVPRSSRMTTAESAAAIVEGVLLARYRFSLRSTEPETAEVASLTLVAPEGERAAVEEGAARGRLMARVGMLSRDLSTSPAGMLTATAMADLAVELGPGGVLAALGAEGPHRLRVPPARRVRGLVHRPHRRLMT